MKNSTNNCTLCVRVCLCVCSQLGDYFSFRKIDMFYLSFVWVSKNAELCLRYL